MTHLNRATVRRGTRPISLASDAPAWFLSMADKTWETPVTNTLDAVKPVSAEGHGAVCSAWTGGAVDQSRREFILAANGGHGDYPGNEVYACALGVSAPAWERLTDPSATTGGTGGTNTAANYGDGLPRAMHGWHRCCGGGGRIWYPGVDGMYPGGQWSSACYSFNRATGLWEYHGLGIPTANGDYVGEAGVGLYDPVDNLAWGFAGYGATSAGVGYYSVDASGTITRYAVRQDRQSRWGFIAHDLRLLVLGNMYQGDLSVYDLEDMAAGPMYIEPDNAELFAGDGAGAVYHEASRGGLFWDGYGAGLRKLAIPEDPINGTWAWSEVAADGSNAVTPSSPAAAGTYSKFNIIEDMGNGQSALCVVNAVDEPVYVYKLPAGGV